MKFFSEAVCFLHYPLFLLVFFWGGTLWSNCLGILLIYGSGDQFPICQCVVSLSMTFYLCFLLSTQLIDEFPCCWEHHHDRCLFYGYKFFLEKWHLKVKFGVFYSYFSFIVIYCIHFEVQIVLNYL